MIELLPILISNMVVACALALVATVVGWSGRRAALARWIWIAVFLKLVTPPLLSVPFELFDGWAGQVDAVSTYLKSSRLEIPAVDLHAGTMRTSSADAPLSGKEADAAVPQSILAISVVEIMLAAWMLGCCWLLLRGGWRYQRMVQLLKTQAEENENGTRIVRELLQRPEPAFVPIVRLIPARLSPMLFGIGPSTSIVCPRELWLKLDEDERTAFLAHESAHFARRDHWVRWLEWTITSLYWWLPLVYWARIQLERHEEVACDAAALRLLQRRTSSPVRRSYAESLLSVVDFLSEAEASAPRLASRMQPTAALEERLHWIMSVEPCDKSWRLSMLTGVAIGVLSLLIHPTVRPNASVPATAAVTSVSSEGPQVALSYDTKIEAIFSPVAKAMEQTKMPSAPRGWWNEPPENLWADSQLGDKELRVTAQVGHGIDVTGPGGSHTTFDTPDVRGLAYIPGTARLVVARHNGELHLWDAASGRSVSLIGKHSSAITSTSWSASGGLISSDGGGTLVRWDMLSGQMLASCNLDQPLSAVRWSHDGREIAVLPGKWSQSVARRQLVILNGRSLERLRSIPINHETAVVHSHAQLGWLAVTWSGFISQVSTGKHIGVIPKNAVSGAVLCAELMPNFEIATEAAALE